MKSFKLKILILKNINFILKQTIVGINNIINSNITSHDSKEKIIYAKEEVLWALDNQFHKH